VLTPLPQQPPQHRGSVWACRFRPPTEAEPSGAGPVLVSLANDGLIRLWDTATGRSRRIQRGHGRKIGSIDYSADGTLLAAAGNDGQVRLWDSGTGVRTAQLKGNSDQLVSAVFSPSGPLLATASNDGDVYLWNAATGEFQREIDAETDHTWAEAFDRSGEIIATANDDDSVQLWYRTTGARVIALPKHRGRVRSIAFDPDGAHVATGADDRLVRVWDLKGESTAELEGHTDRVYAVVFGRGAAGGGDARDDGWMASASWDGSAIVWRDGAPAQRLVGHVGRIWRRRATTARSASGTCARARRPTGWTDRSGGSCRSPSARTAASWPRRARTARSACGASRRTRSRRCRRR
jgi:WD40 repeat protein